MCHLQKNIGELVDERGLADTSLAVDDECHARALVHPFRDDRSEFIQFRGASDKDIFLRRADFRDHAHPRLGKALPARGGFKIGVLDLDAACLLVELVVAQQRARILRALERVFFDAPHDDPAKKCVPQLFRKRRHGLTHLLEKHFSLVLAVHRPLAGQHLVQDQAERIDVCRCRRALAHRLFRRHVMRCPWRAPFRRKMRRFHGFPTDAQRLVRQILHQPEVKHLHKILLAILHAQHQVRRLQVAMHHPAFMRFAQRFQNLVADVQAPVVTQRTLVFQHFRQRLAVQPFHHQEQKSRLRLAIVEYRDRVRMTKLARQKRFLPELLHVVRVVAHHIGLQDFKRDISPQVVLKRTIYGSKTSKAYALKNGIAIG